MIAAFRYRGVDYTVSGWLWSADGAGNGMIVRREDGRAIRGTSMHESMVQLGLSDGLDRAAKRALDVERAKGAVAS